MVEGAGLKIQYKETIVGSNPTSHTNFIIVLMTTRAAMSPEHIEHERKILKARTDLNCIFEGKLFC